MNENKEILNGKELLMKRRSVRKFKDKDVTEDILARIFELSRYVPTSNNSQGYYFVVIRNKKTLKSLGSTRGMSSSPIYHAPIAVAICVDTNKTSRPVHDGCISAYHFMLAARLYNLGTCWVADMDRESVKKTLDTPKNHFVATVTPVGYPLREPDMPKRKTAKEFVKWLD